MTLEEYIKTITFPLRQATLCFLIKDDQILLAMKKRGFGAGRWNGSGGKVETGESVEEAVTRETREEINVSPENLQHVATLDFYNPAKPDWNEQVLVYLSDKWEGEPEESEEMKPQWFAKNNLPFADMWPGDRHWLPPVLQGKKVKGVFMFAENGSIADYKLEDLQ